jgi:hypothetical protein
MEPPLPLAFSDRVVLKREIGRQGKMTPRARSDLVRESALQPRASTASGLASCTLSPSFTSVGQTSVEKKQEVLQYLYIILIPPLNTFTGYLSDFNNPYGTSSNDPTFGFD